MMWWHYLLQLWLCLYFWSNLHRKPGPSAICLPLSPLVSRCVFFFAKTWSCDVQGAQEQLPYGQTLLCPFDSSILPWSLHSPQVLPDIVVSQCFLVRTSLYMVFVVKCLNLCIDQLDKGVPNRPFYWYNSHVELIRFKVCYGMPWGHSLSIYTCFSGKKRTSLYISWEKGDHYYIFPEFQRTTFYSLSTSELTGC